MSTATASYEVHDLLSRYVDVTNAVLYANEDRFPWKQILDATERLVGGKRIGIAVYGREPDNPQHYATVTLKDGRLHLLGEGGRAEGVDYWKTSRAHLEHVVSDPGRYVDNPAQLDLDWLRTRLGL